MAKFLSTAIPYGFAIGLSGCLAAVSGAHWFIQLQGQPSWVIAVAVFGSVCVSALVGVCAYLFGRGYGRVLVLVGLAFMAADAYQNSLGYQTMTSLTVSADIQTAEESLAAAQLDLAAVTLPERDCLCPKTKAADVEQFHAKRITPLANIATAEAKLEALTTPKAKTEYVMAVMAFLQIALSVLFACLGRGRKSEPVTVQAEHQEPATQDNVVRFVRPARMDEKDMRVWGKIAKV